MEVFTEQFNMWNEMKLEVSVVSKKTYNRFLFSTE